MSIDVYNAYSNLTSNPAWVYGEAVVSQGLYTRQAISGYGLITRGFLWGLYDIWIDIERAAPITTNWAAASGSSITTTWTASIQGLSGY